MHSQIIEPIIVIFNNYLMTLQPNVHLGFWHNLILYEPYSSSKMDNGWIIFWSHHTWHNAKCNTSAYVAPMVPACWRTQTFWKKNPCNCKLGNHYSLPHFAYNFLAVLKGGSKSIHVLKEEFLKELIVWLQEFVPPPTCFLAKWIIRTCRDDESYSHSLFWAKHPMAYRHG